MPGQLSVPTIDRTLLDDREVRLALARRDLPFVYQHLVRNGVSQRSISALTGQQPSEVSAIVGGRSVASYALLERIATGLGIERGWLGLAYATGPDTEPVPTDDLPEQVKRDRFLKIASAAVTGTPVLGEAGSIPAPAASTPCSARVRSSDVRRLVAATERLTKVEAQLGGGAVHAMLTAHARAAEAMLDLTTSTDDDTHHRLQLAVAETHRIAGAAAADAGAYDLSRFHLLTGLQLVREDRDWTVKLINTAAHSMIDHDPEAALKLFQLGIIRLPARLHIGAALLYAGAAHAFALLDLPDEAKREIREAWRACPDGHTTDSDCWAGVTRADILTTIAQARAAMNDRLAIDELTACIDMVEPTYVRTVALLHAALAVVQLRAGHLKGGVQSARAALAGAEQVRSGRVHHRLSQLHAALVEKQDNTCQELARVLRHPPIG